MNNYIVADHEKYYFAIYEFKYFPLFFFLTIFTYSIIAINTEYIAIREIFKSNLF